MLKHGNQGKLGSLSQNLIKILISFCLLRNYFVTYTLNRVYYIFRAL